MSQLHLSMHNTAKHSSKHNLPLWSLQGWCKINNHVRMTHWHGITQFHTHF